MTEYTIEIDNRVCHVKLAGDLTASMVPVLREDLKGAISNGATGAVFDMPGVATLDSGSIGLLLATANSLERSGGRVRVVNASDGVLRLMRSIGLSARMEVAPRADGGPADG